MDEFSNDFLLSEFKKSNSSKLWLDEDYDYKKYLSVYRGRPICGGLEYITLDAIVSDPHYEYNKVSIFG